MMSGSRAVIRIARRSLRRDPWRAALVVILISLPVMGITTASMVLTAAIPTSEERATRQMGAADMIAEPIGSYGREQLTSCRHRQQAGTRLDRGRPAAGVGSHPDVRVLFADLTGPAAGMLDLLAGRAPVAPDEVAVSAAVLRLAGAGLGSTIPLATQGSVRVVGEVEDPTCHLGPRRAG